MGGLWSEYIIHMWEHGVTEAIITDGPMTSWFKIPATCRSSLLAVLPLRDVLVVKTEGGPGGERAGSMSSPQV